jgi:Fe-S cluster assembly scaffold protein SufB
MILVLLLFTFAFSVMANIHQKFFLILSEKDYYRIIHAQTEKIYNEKIHSKWIDSYFYPGKFFKENSVNNNNNNNNNNNEQNKKEIEKSVISHTPNSIDNREFIKIPYYYNYDNRPTFNFVSVGDFDCKKETRKHYSKHCQFIS